MTFNPALTCPHCGQIQYASRRSRMQMAMLPMISLFPLLLNMFTSISKTVVLGLIPLLALTSLALYPFFMRVSNEDEMNPPLH